MHEDLCMIFPDLPGHRSTLDTLRRVPTIASIFKDILPHSDINLICKA